MESHEFIAGVEMSVVQCVLLSVVSPSRHGKAKEFMTGMSMEVTVGDLTVVITDYEPKPKRKRSSTDSHDSSSFLSNTDTGSPSLSNGRAPDWGAGFVERPAAFLIACFVWLLWNRTELCRDDVLIFQTAASPSWKAERDWGCRRSRWVIFWWRWSDVKMWRCRHFVRILYLWCLWWL